MFVPFRKLMCSMGGNIPLTKLNQHVYLLSRCRVAPRQWPKAGLDLEISGG